MESFFIIYGLPFWFSNDIVICFLWRYGTWVLWGRRTFWSNNEGKLNKNFYVVFSALLMSFEFIFELISCCFWWKDWMYQLIVDVEWDVKWDDFKILNIRNFFCIFGPKVLHAWSFWIVLSTKVLLRIKVSCIPPTVAFCLLAFQIVCFRLFNLIECRKVVCLKSKLAFMQRKL